MKIKYLVGISIVGLICSIAPVRAQSGFPAKSVRIVTLTAAGGTLDLVARSIAQKLSEQMGQSMLVENKLGAGGNVGADVVAKSTPDGYTIGKNAVSTHDINPTLFGKALTFDAVKDFAPITLVAE